MCRWLTSATLLFVALLNMGTSVCLTVPPSLGGTCALYLSCSGGCDGPANAPVPVGTYGRPGNCRGLFQDPPGNVCDMVYLSAGLDIMSIFIFSISAITFFICPLCVVVTPCTSDSCNFSAIILSNTEDMFASSGWNLGILSDLVAQNFTLSFHALLLSMMEKKHFVYPQPLSHDELMDYQAHGCVSGASPVTLHLGHPIRCP